MKHIKTIEAELTTLGIEIEIEEPIQTTCYERVSVCCSSLTGCFYLLCCVPCYFCFD